ncbi:hypothetical protein MNBD_ALPHA03-889 [hydrothermal vent metagenome]|uniref:Uncharacterized protein n=1 Tax=hydrothermal vent metagenome TaxID=652676 RepID=A0A3B1B272_9ZZZZ
MNFKIAGYYMLLLLFPLSVGAESLSGKIQLPSQNILVSGPQKYQGQIDLRPYLPMGDEFVLTKVIVNFLFRDDKEWVRTVGKSSLEDTGKIIRHSGSAFRKKSISGQTDYYYISRRVIDMTNEEEVAQLTIGRNVFYGTTMRRRDVTKKPVGQKSVMLGTYREPGDNARLRQHFRITDEILETRRDGYDGFFEIRHKYLDLSAVQDIARTGLIKFELAGQGDYIFVEARATYEGYIMGPKSASLDTSLYKGPIWLTMLGLPIGGAVWWRKRQKLAHKKQKKKQARQRSARAVNRASSRRALGAE